jgi:serine/threonine protein kinase/tetratricopeptide (TPR) repeat protein
MIEEEIFHEALTRDLREERSAYLEQACAGNPRLRASVEALLRAHVGASGFLEAPIPALGATAEVAITERPGTVIGPYKLLEQIGEGGFGVVFMAEQQQPLRRLVAVKVLKPGMDTRQVIARFEAERQALALMDHPNIARVLDAGQTASGRPYFVMELVKGVPITEFCDESQLPPRDRLRLFGAVCQAVQHAHQKGVIHRDLKPTNVLVTLHDGVPVVKVIDFGIAKALGQRLTDKTLVTGFAQMIGTPLYMSPEQAELSGLDVDTRSDIYSLGVLLYELLTGTTPFDQERLRSAGYDELRRIIREEQPPKPSTRISTLGQAATTVSTQRQSDPQRLSRLFRGELDWIVMKALEKDRSRRYETASAFAADVQRYLDDEPVQACPPSAGYRIKKLVRRHKGKVAVGLAMTVLLLAGVVASTWQAVRATRAEGVARTALAAETAAKAQAREALDALTDDAVERFLARQPELGDEEKAFLRKVLGFYEEFTRQLGETAEARFLRAKGYFKVALVRTRLGEEDEALAGFRQACDLFQQLVADFPDVPLYRDKYVRSIGYVGEILRKLGRVAEAATLCRQAVALREDLVAEIPAEREYRLSLAHEYKGLIIVLFELGKDAEAEAVSRQALAVCDRLDTESPDVPAYRRELAISYNNLGRVIQHRGRYPEAETAYRQSISVAEKLVADFPAVPGYREDLARTNNNLGQMLRAQGKYAEAKVALRQALTLHERLVADYPAVRSYQECFATSQYDCGHLLLLQDRPAEALPWYDRALALLQPLHRHEPRHVYIRRDLCNAHRGRAQVLDALQRHTEAQADWDRAVELAPPADKPWVQLLRDQSWVKAGKVAEAVADADMLTKDPATPGSTLYDAACVYALAAYALAAAAVPTDAKQRAAYADQAIAFLRRAQATGFFKDRRRVEHLKNDTDLDALRPREDFQKIVVELEAATEKEQGLTSQRH